MHFGISDQEGGIKYKICRLNLEDFLFFPFLLHC